MVYKSKIDTWVVLILVGLPLGLLFGVAFAETPSAVELIIVVPAVGAATLLLAWMLATTDYRFRDDSLHIRSGPFKSTIPVADVKRIEQTRSLASGPALLLGQAHYSLRTIRQRSGLSQEQRRFLVGIGISPRCWFNQKVIRELVSSQVTSWRGSIKAENEFEGCVDVSQIVVRQLASNANQPFATVHRPSLQTVRY